MLTFTDYLSEGLLDRFSRHGNSKELKNAKNKALDEIRPFIKLLRDKQGFDGPISSMTSNSMEKASEKFRKQFETDFKNAIVSKYKNLEFLGLGNRSEFNSLKLFDEIMVNVINKVDAIDDDVKAVNKEFRHYSDIENKVIEIAEPLEHAKSIEEINTILTKFRNFKKKIQL